VAIVTGGARAPQPATMLGPQISRVGALAAWRATQGLYRALQKQHGSLSVN
jgi:hypothetical protein